MQIKTLFFEFSLNTFANSFQAEWSCERLLICQLWYGMLADSMVSKKNRPKITLGLVLPDIAFVFVLLGPPAVSTAG